MLFSDPFSEVKDVFLNGTERLEKRQVSQTMPELLN